jgi:protein-cysteine N-palmitoyltransferase HHAT
MPLFLSGPITTFNSWISQIHKPQNTHTKKQIMIYTLRTLALIIVIEMFCHLVYIETISSNPLNEYIWKTFTIKEIAMSSFFKLVFLWLKFVVIWRIARNWALLDGVESPENMNRCVVNNYCFEGFWRSWHRSFNQWLIRYIFIPLGGSKYKYYNIWVVFTFVAYWHEQSPSLLWNLLVWAWVICLCIMLEIGIKGYFMKTWVS